MSRKFRALEDTNIHFAVYETRDITKGEIITLKELTEHFSWALASGSEDGATYTMEKFKEISPAEEILSNLFCVEDSYFSDGYWSNDEEIEKQGFELLPNLTGDSFLGYICNLSEKHWEKTTKLFVHTNEKDPGMFEITKEQYEYLKELKNDK